MVLNCIPFINIPLSYISELFMGGVWVWTPFLLISPHFGRKILTLLEDIKFPCNFHKILTDFSKNCPDNCRFNRKILEIFSHKFFLNIDRNADEISTTFEMASNEQIFAVFRQFEINSHN